MKKWLDFVSAIISLLLAIFALVAGFTDLVVERDEPVTITTTIISCQTWKVSDGSETKKTIYFEIDQPPNLIKFNIKTFDPPEYEEGFSKICQEKDTVNLTYRRIYSHLSGWEGYWLRGMESVTDGQIILTPADLEAEGRWDWIFSTFLVIFFLFGFFWCLRESFKPNT